MLDMEYTYYMSENPGGLTSQVTCLMQSHGKAGNYRYASVARYQGTDCLGDARLYGIRLRAK